MPSLPLAAPIQPRSASLAKDQRLTNCFVEQQAEGLQIVKRPGLSQFATVTPGCAQLIAVTPGGVIVTVTGGTGTAASGTFIDATNWTQVALSAGIGARDTHGLLAFNSAIYAFNGENGSGGGFYRDVWKTTDGITWTLMSATSTGYYRYGFGYCIHNSVMYLAGGIGNPTSSSGVGNTTLNDVWYSNADGSSWTQATAAASWPARSHAGLLSDGTNLYITGGADVSSVHRNDVWKSADNGATWSQVLADTGSPGASQFVRRAYHGTAYWQGKLWVFGGLGVSNTYLNDVWYSSNQGATWTQATASAAWSARQNFAFWVANSKLWVAGGVNATPASLNDVYSTTDGATWTQERAPTSDPIAMSSLTRSGTTATGTTTSAHGLTVGENVLVAGAIETAYNGNFTVLTTPTSTTFTYTVSGSPATPATGSPNASACWPPLNRGRAVYFGSKAWIVGGFMNGVTKDTVWSSGTATSNIFAVTTTPVCVPIDSLDLSSTVAVGASGQFWKTTTQAWIFDGSNLTPITDPDYPATTVRGVVWLDSYVFVMTPDGVIHNSDLNNPSSWAATSFISANAEPDAGVAIARQLNYLVAFGEWSTEFFYDAGNAAPGSPLSKVLNAFLEVGCASGASIAPSDNTLYYISQSKTKGRSVMRLNGYVPERLSNEWIDRILNADDLVGLTAYCVKPFGHWFYIVNLPTSSISLAYDSITGEWHRWTSGYADSAKAVSTLTYDATTGLATITFTASQTIVDGDPVTVAGATQADYNGLVVLRGNGPTSYTYIPLTVPGVSPATGTITGVPYLESTFVGKFYANTETQDLFLDASSGVIYQLSEAATTDNGVPINVTSRIPEWDNGSMKTKFFAELEIVGDKVAADLWVRYTDDDWQNFSLYRPARLDLGRSRLLNLGSAIRRAHEFRHTAATTLRLRRADVIVTEGP